MSRGTSWTNAIPTGFDHSRKYPQVKPGGQGRSQEEDETRSVLGKDPYAYAPQDYQEMVELYLERRRPWAEQWLRNEAIYEKSPDLFGGGTLEDAAATQYTHLGRAYGIVHTLESMVFNRKPKLFVSSLTGEETEMARLWEDLLNNEWAFQADLKRETRLSVRDCIISGMGVDMTFWDAEFEEVLRKVKKRTKITDEARKAGFSDELAEQRMEILATQGEVGHEPEKEVTWESDMRVRREQASSIRISHWDFLFDPMARHWSQVQWVGRRLELPIWDIMKGPFDNTDGLSPDLEYSRQFWPESKIRAGASAYVSTSTDGIARDLREWVTLYEIFDLRTNKLVTICPGYDEFLRYQDNPFYTEHPYSVLQWNHRGEGLFASADLSVVYGLIEEEEDLRTKLQDAFSREAIDVYMVNANSGIGEESIEAITAPDGSLFVPMRKGDDARPISNDIQGLGRQPKSPDLAMHFNRIEKDIMQGLGLGPNQTGSALKSDTTASEAMEIAGFARSRGEFKYDAVEQFIGEIAYKRLSMYAQFADENHIRRVAGNEAAKLWSQISFTKGDVQHRFSCRVEEGSVRPTNDQTRLATFEKMFMMAQQFPAVAQVMNVPELLKRWFDTLGVKDGDTLINITDPNEAAAVIAQAQQMGMGSGGGGPQAPTAAAQAENPNQGVLGAMLGGAK